MTPRVRELLRFYQSENPAILCRLASLLNHGATAGTGKLLLSTVDSSLEYGPAESCAFNPDSYHPQYHFRLATRAGLSALVAPIGTIELVAGDFAGECPWILKANHSVSLSMYHDVLKTSDWKSCLRLGAVGVCFTLALGTEKLSPEVEGLIENIAKAKEHGLLVMLEVTRKSCEEDDVKREALSLNQTTYAVHLACQLGVHIISIPPLGGPVAGLKEFYSNQRIQVEKMKTRMTHVMQTAFAEQRIVISRLRREVELERNFQEAEEMIAGGVFGLDFGAVAHLKPENEMVEEMKQYQQMLV